MKLSNFSEANTGFYFLMCEFFKETKKKETLKTSKNKCEKQPRSQGSKYSRP